MVSGSLSPRFLKQTALLTIGTFVFFLLFYGLPVSNAVLATYYAGGKAFVNHTDPYQVTAARGPSNQFKYSPLFATTMAAMAKVKAQPIAVGAWIAIGMAVFFLGISNWVNLSGTVPLWLTLAVIAAILELTFSMVVTQANALVIGLLLLGLAAYREQRFFSAGAAIMLATNLKVYPVIFLIALALRLERRYLVGAFVSGLVTFILPALVVGWTHNLNTHIAWVRLVLQDTGGGGVLDLASAFERAGLNTLGHLLRAFILLLTVPVFFAYAAFLKRIDWRPWLTFGIAALLLLSPRTECFTFVLLAPSYLLMTAWCAESKSDAIRHYGSIVFAALALLITSSQFTTSQWLSSQAPTEICRVIGTLGFWIASGYILINAIGSLRRQPRLEA